MGSLGSQVPSSLSLFNSTPVCDLSFCVCLSLYLRSSPSLVCTFLSECPVRSPGTVEVGRVNSIGSPRRPDTERTKVLCPTFPQEQYVDHGRPDVPHTDKSALGMSTVLTVTTTTVLNSFTTGRPLFKIPFASSQKGTTCVINVKTFRPTYNLVESS